MSDSDARSKTTVKQSVKCSNCMTTSEVEVPSDLLESRVEEEIRVKDCPDCGLPHLSAVEKTSCMDCGSKEFNLIQEEAPRSMSGPQPTLKCVDCGREAEIDEDGAWW